MAHVLQLWTLLLVGYCGEQSRQALRVSLNPFSFRPSPPCIDETIRAFWQIEEVAPKEIQSPADKQTEASFSASHIRDSFGRFGVHLPFKDLTALPKFPGMLDIANRRLLSLERRLSNQPVLRELYVSFMQDYLDAGHMSLAPAPASVSSYFVPHHCVVKAGPEGPKVRVVFDASPTAENRLSLNDALLVGPKLQNDIVSVLLRFCLNKFVFTCDIRQMYRQILVVDSHRNYQYIRWRFSVDDPIHSYRLNTVTY